MKKVLFTCSVDCKTVHISGFKYWRAVKQKVWSKAEKGVRDWGETLFFWAWRASGVRLWSRAKPILRKKPTVLQSTCSAVVFLFKKTLFLSHCHRHCVIIPFGRFPFILKFRKFRLQIKWNRPFRFGPTGMFGTTFEGGLPWPVWSFRSVGPKFISLSIWQNCCPQYRSFESCLQEQ